HGNLHARRRCSARVLSRSAGRNGWRERTHSRADGLPQLRWLEALVVRRSARARPGGRAFLHVSQNHHVTLADRLAQRIRLRDAHDEIEHRLVGNFLEERRKRGSFRTGSFCKVQWWNLRRRRALYVTVIQETLLP